MEFARESASDPLAGSPQLRDEVIRSAVQAVDQLDLSKALDARPAPCAGRTWLARPAGVVVIHRGGPRVSHRGAAIA